MEKEYQYTPVMLDKDVHATLKDHCDKHGTKVQHVVSVAVKEYLERNQGK